MTLPLHATLGVVNQLPMSAERLGNLRRSGSVVRQVGDQLVQLVRVLVDATTSLGQLRMGPAESGHLSIGIRPRTQITSRLPETRRSAFGSAGTIVIGSRGAGLSSPGYL